MREQLNLVLEKCSTLNVVIFPGSFSCFRDSFKMTRSARTQVFIDATYGLVEKKRNLLEFHKTENNTLLYLGFAEFCG